MLGLFFSILACIAFSHFCIGNKDDFRLWIGIFAFYLVYMTLTNLFISNPFVDYFVSVDQLHLYEESLALSHESFKDIIDDTFGLAYIQCPLTYVSYAYILKFAHLIGITNDLYFLKLSIVFCGSLIFPLIAKIVRVYGYEGAQINKNIALFAILSPILCYSCQIIRDVQICFLYTLLFYLVVKPKIRLRIVWLLSLILVTYFYRYESGLFSILFIGLLLVKNVYETRNSGYKILLFGAVLLGFIIILGYVENVMLETFDRYNMRATELADEGSLGMKLAQLPFPLDVLGKTVFGQMLPFPCWAPLTSGESYAFLRIIECFFPFFWIPVLLSLLYSLLYLRRKNLPFFSIVILFSFGYIVLCSASTFDTRRVMAVYPILFGIFMVISQNHSLPIKLFRSITLVSLLFLYLLYFIIKG